MTVITAGRHELQGTGTEIISCFVRDKKGNRRPVLLQGISVSGLGRDIFSPTSQLQD